MNKEIHIWLNDDWENTIRVQDMCLTLDTTYLTLKSNKVNIINTTQPHFCSTMWIARGYKIFVHMIDGEIVEMKLGYINHCAKEIRIIHNIEKMLMCNCFGYATRDFDDFENNMNKC